MDSWEIHDQYYGKVRKFILTYVKDEWVADDLIQETFARTQENLKSLKKPSKLSSWIYRIAYNLCQDHFRNIKKSSSKQSAIQEKIQDFKDVLVEKKLEQGQMGQCVQDQMDLLPEPLRIVLVLFEIMELSHREISEILGITVENVKVRLHRARKKLKSILEEKCTFEKDERNVLVCDPVQSEDHKMKH